ncbi:MAG: hypothetical protein N2560_07745 [Ignavibacteria bacterium]|nr:hypothetical protein [Ignavibacteria bacterium]
MLKNGKFAIFISLAIVVASCIIVKEKVPDEEFSSEFTLLSKPTVPIGDIAIRSERGDMIAYLPQGWFLVDLEEKAPTNIFAVGVNPDYTLSIIFSRLTNKLDVVEILKEQGLLGLATKSFEIKQLKSLNNIKLLGNFEPIKNGTQKFYIFKYQNLTNKLVGKSAIFVTPLSEVYEFALIQLDFKEQPTISESDFDNIFNSVLSTIKF